MTELPIVRCNFGMRGYGKTTLARGMIAARERLLICDQMKDYRTEALQLEIQDFEAYLDDNPLERFRVAMTTTGSEAYFCAMAWEIASRVGRENELCLTVLLEEADLIAPPGREPWIVKRLAAQGRHYGIELIACSRRPSEVSRHLTANADELNLFRTQEPRDLMYYRQFIDNDAIDAVCELEKYEFVHWTLDGWEKRSLTGPGGTWATTSRRGSEAQKILDERAGAV